MADEKAIKDWIGKFMKETGGPAFEDLFAKVKHDLEDAEKRLPPGPDGKPMALGLPDAFIESLVRRYYLQTIGNPAFLDALVDQVVKTVREGHGPTRRNRVALA